MAVCLNQFQSVAEYGTVKGLLTKGIKKPLGEQIVQEWVSTVKSTLTTLKSVANDRPDSSLEWYLEK